MAVAATNGLTGVRVFGLVGRVRARAHAVDKLNAQIAKARASPEMQTLIRDASSTELKGSSAEFAAFVRAEYKRGATLVRISGATLE
jgi:tripartite-type tricarboxylate transporter receptor subunit TctC